METLVDSRFLFRPVFLTRTGFHFARKRYSNWFYRQNYFAAKAIGFTAGLYIFPFFWPSCFQVSWAARQQSWKLNPRGRICQAGTESCLSLLETCQFHFRKRLFPYRLVTSQCASSILQNIKMMNRWFGMLEFHILLFRWRWGLRCELLLSRQTPLRDPSQAARQ